MKSLRVLKTILKHTVSIILIFIALGAIGFALSPPGRASGFMGVTMLVLFGIWCGGLVLFLHFHRRVSLIARRRMALVLVAFLPLWILAWTKLDQVGLYLEHRDWLTYESEHFVFHYAPDYPHQDEIAIYATVRDAAFEYNCEYLGVTLDRKIDFYVYDELAMGHAEGWEDIIFADHGQSIGHEMTHIIAYHIAGKRQKIKLLDEGIATWLNHSIVVADHHHAAWEYIQEHDLLPLTGLAHNKTFRRQRPQPYYPAASFVGYLIDNYRLDTFRRLWTLNAAYPEIYTNLEDFGWAHYFSFIPGQQAHFGATVKEVYGRSLDELDTEWRAWLEERYGKQ
ncbi:MAG: hypothetical protein ISS50_05400 [Anaerolineae bacterium]|nr:hypothetical protein [Anaerolineae bacterium]